MGLFGKKKSDPAGQSPSVVLIRFNGADDLWGKFRFPLGPGRDIIGRDDSCSIRLTDPQVSREHCSIDYHLQAGGFVLCDISSVNGTEVNGTRLEGSKVLTEGDVIGVGNSLFLFTCQKVEGQVPAIHFKRHGQNHMGTLPGDAAKDGA